jgi:hypothetical protein
MDGWMDGKWSRPATNHSDVGTPTRQFDLESGSRKTVRVLEDLETNQSQANCDGKLEQVRIRSHVEGMKSSSGVERSGHRRRNENAALMDEASVRREVRPLNQNNIHHDRGCHFGKKLITTVMGSASP